MATRIEQELMIPGGFLALAGFAIGPEEIQVRLQTWELPPKCQTLLFKNASISSVEAVYDTTDSEETLDLPWDIIGFESDRLDNQRWKFILVSHVLELAFVSEWPII